MDDYALLISDDHVLSPRDKVCKRLMMPLHEDGCSIMLVQFVPELFSAVKPLLELESASPLGSLWRLLKVRWKSFDNCIAITLPTDDLHDLTTCLQQAFFAKQVKAYALINDGS